MLHLEIKFDLCTSKKLRMIWKCVKKYGIYQDLYIVNNIKRWRLKSRNSSIPKVCLKNLKITLLFICYEL